MLPGKTNHSIYQYILSPRLCDFHLKCGFARASGTTVYIHTTTYIAIFVGHITKFTCT